MSVTAHCQLRHVTSNNTSHHKQQKHHLTTSFLKPYHHHHHSPSTTFIKLKLKLKLKLNVPALFQQFVFHKDLSNLFHSSCFNTFLPPQAFVIYFCCLFLVLIKQDILVNHLTPFEYTCEDVSHYYNSLDHSKGEALKRKLHSIISIHKSLPYREVWEALKILDADNSDMPEASSGIVEIYSLRVVPKVLAGKPQGWNREHLWPRSYGLISRPSLTDLHNIRPADVNVNSARGNKFYGECDEDQLRKCSKPANKEAAPDTMTDSKSWTPPMQVRGDIARALMYMAVAYGYDHSGGASGLQLSDSPNIGNREMGILTTLLKWNHLDPPSMEEKVRNDRVCKMFQHNRNPFVDHPEYADFIWRQNSSSGK